MPNEDGSLSPQEFVLEAMKRMHEEIECAQKHFEIDDYQNIVMHMTNLASGCKVTAEAICEFILNRDQVIELLKAKLEETFGNPIEYVGPAGEYEGFRMVPIEVPDDASGLDDGE